MARRRHELAATMRIPNNQWLFAAPGSEIHHASRIEVAVAVERGRPTQVRVAGEVQPMMNGTLELP